MTIREFNRLNLSLRMRWALVSIGRYSKGRGAKGFRATYIGERIHRGSFNALRRRGLLELRFVRFGRKAEREPVYVLNQSGKAAAALAMIFVN